MVQPQCAVLLVASTHTHNVDPLLTNLQGRVMQSLLTTPNEPASANLDIVAHTHESEGKLTTQRSQ